MAVPLCDFSSVHTLSSLPSRKDIDIYKMKYVTIKTNSTSDSVLSGEGGGDLFSPSNGYITSIHRGIDILN